MRRDSLIEYLDNFYRRGPEVAYTQRRGYRVFRWSYRQVVETACQFARELEARRIGKGDRVLIWGENCAEWVAAFFGCLLRGVVVVPMDRIAPVDLARRLAQQVNAKLLVGSRQQTQLDCAVPVLSLENLSEHVARHWTERYHSPDLTRTDVVQIVFTSGATADPKGVVISHGNILANLEPLEAEINKHLKYERLVHPIRFLNLLPLSHVFGQFLGIFVPQLLGGSVIFQDRLEPYEVIRAIKRERASALVAVPRLLESLRRKIEQDLETAGRSDRFRQQFQAAEGEHIIKRWWRFRRIHSAFGWKFWAFISGGAALDADTEVFWRRLGMAVIQGYGLTETTSLISVNHPFKLQKGSIGKVLPGREVKLDENGEILVRGESIAAGYWQGEQLKPVVGQQEWFHTGDLGQQDEQGNLYFRGRKKNVIVTSEGMNVYPQDLEATLRRQPEVRDCVVIGLAGNGNAEPCAVLIVREDVQDPGSIVKQANASLAEYQRIRRWVVWPEEDFPRTSTEKPRLKLIQQVVQARLGEQHETRLTSTTLADLIGRVTGRALVELPPGASLASDLGLNSIERVELMSAIEDRYQIEVNESTFAAATTLGELERMLRQPAHHQSDYVYPRWTRRWPVTWLRAVVYYLLIWPATLLLGYPRVMGRRNLGGVRGPVLVISNHITFLDLGLILAALPLRLRHRLAVAMEGERLASMRRPPADLSLFRRWIGKLTYLLVIGLFNVFPLPQKTGFRESFAFAGQAIDRGLSLLVFPEGQRTKDGRMAPFRAGIGLLASNLNVPIVPLRIDGLFALKQAGKKMTRPGAIKITIGSPLRCDPAADPASIARQLEECVASLDPNRQ